MQYNSTFGANVFPSFRATQPLYTPPISHNNGLFPEVVGEGEVVSVLFPDGNVQFYFIPSAYRINNNTPYQNPTFGAWFVRSISNPIPFPLYPYGHQAGKCNMSSTEFKIKFHYDRCTSTTDIHYFYPALAIYNCAYQVAPAFFEAPPRTPTTQELCFQRPCKCKHDTNEKVQVKCMSEELYKMEENVTDMECCFQEVKKKAFECFPDSKGICIKAPSVTQKQSYVQEDRLPIKRSTFKEAQRVNSLEYPERRERTEVMTKERRTEAEKDESNKRCSCCACNNSNKETKTERTDSYSSHSGKTMRDQGMENNDVGVSKNRSKTFQAIESLCNENRNKKDTGDQCPNCGKRIHVETDGRAIKAERSRDSIRSLSSEQNVYDIKNAERTGSCYCKNKPDISGSDNDEDENTKRCKWNGTLAPKRRPSVLSSFHAINEQDPKQNEQLTNVSSNTCSHPPKRNNNPAELWQPITPLSRKTMKNATSNESFTICTCGSSCSFGGYTDTTPYTS